MKIFLNKGYFPFCISQFLGIFNDQFFRIALAIYIMMGANSLSQGTRYFFASFLIAVFMLPSLLFSATAGEIADKYRKDIIIRIVKIAQLLLAFIGIAGFLLHSVTILLIVLFLAGTISTLFSPTKYSAIPEFLKQEDLVAGNTIIQVGNYISMLLGIICGILVYSIDRSWLFLIYLAVAVIGFIASLYIPELKKSTQKFKISKYFIKTTIKNMHYLKYTKDIYMCILGISWFWFIGVVLVYQIPNFAEIVLKGQKDLYTFLALLLSSGVFVGALLSYFLLKKEISVKYVPISVIFMTLFIVDLSFSAKYVHLALTTNIALTSFLSTFSGIRIIIDVFAYSLFAGLYIVPLITMLQVLAKRKIRARVFAVNDIVNVLFMIAGSSVCFLFIKMYVSSKTH